MHKTTAIIATTIMIIIMTIHNYVVNIQRPVRKKYFFQEIITLTGQAHFGSIKEELRGFFMLSRKGWCCEHFWWG